MTEVSKATLIIAEAGVNHNGSLETALELVDAASEAGADAVKFQTFKADKLVTRAAPKAEYQQRSTNPSESQYDMLKALELSAADHDRLAAYCVECNVKFLSTPFDRESLQMLAHRYKVPLLKLSSGEITNGPLLLDAALTGLPILLSTGMSTLGDVESALMVIAHGYTSSREAIDADALLDSYRSDKGQQALRERVTLLHCTSEYPTIPSQVNLRAMDTLKNAFGLRVGYSDHTRGVAVPIAAVARGANVIEKHFTLDRTMKGPDHHCSLQPDELKALVAGIRVVEQSLGISLKAPTKEEMNTRLVARKSLIANQQIDRGQPLSNKNIDARRPGTGISPMRYWELCGTEALKNYKREDQI